MIEYILIRLLHDDWCLKIDHSTLLQHFGLYLLRITEIFVWWILPSFNDCWSSSFWGSSFGFCWFNWFIFFSLHWSRCTIVKYFSDYPCNLISSYSSRCWWWLSGYWSTYEWWSVRIRLFTDCCSFHHVLSKSTTWT